MRLAGGSRKRFGGMRMHSGIDTLWWMVESLVGSWCLSMCLGIVALSSISTSLHDLSHIFGYLQFRLYRRKCASLSSPKRSYQFIYLLQQPCAPLITNEPPNSFLLARRWLLLPRSILNALPQSKYMTKNLRSNTLLCAQTRDSYQAR